MGHVRSAKDIANSSRGNASLLFVFVLFSITLAAFFSFLQSNNQRRALSNTSWNNFSVAATAQSTFALMESALERRLWEMPPDENCLRKHEVRLHGTMEGGITFEVVAFLIPEQNTIRLTSEAASPMGDVRVVYTKNIKILDVSEFLVATQSPQPTTIGTGASLIAKNRKIYFEGPIELEVARTRWSSASGPQWVKEDLQLPSDIGAILQADQLVFKNGIEYKRRGMSSPMGSQAPYNYPNNGYYYGSTDPRAPTLATYFPENNGFTLAEDQRYYFSSGSGAVALTADYDFAYRLKHEIDTGSPPPGQAALTRSSIMSSIYPKALFVPTDTSLGPMLAQNHADSATLATALSATPAPYMSNHDQWIWTNVSYNGPVGNGNNGDMTCLSRGDRRCSSSLSYPNNFERWKQDRNLSDRLITNDSKVKFQFPVITYDHLEALKEDAIACGLHVDPNDASTFDSSYEDCTLDHPGSIDAYRTQSANPPCRTWYVIDGDRLHEKFSSFTSGGALEDQGRNAADFLRRVVYADVPVEIRQMHHRGLMPLVTNPISRSRVSVWFTGTSQIQLRGAQPDTSSPLDSEPGRLREIVFNMDGTGATVPLPALKLVTLSPDAISFVSPFFTPTTRSDLLTYLPVHSNRVVPSYFATTDWVHQEEDAFKYGYRKITVNNLVIISGIQTPMSPRFSWYPNPTLFVRGLWDAIEDPAIVAGFRSACMLSTRYDNAQVVGTSTTINNPGATGMPADPSPEDPPVGWGFTSGSPAWLEYRNTMAPPNFSSGQGGTYFPPDTSKFYYRHSGVVRADGQGWPWVFRKQRIALGGAKTSVDFRGLRVILSFSNQIPAGKTRDLTQPFAFEMVGGAKYSQGGDWAPYTETNTSGVVTYGTFDLRNRRFKMLNSGHYMTTNPASNVPQPEINPTTCAIGTTLINENYAPLYGASLDGSAICDASNYWFKQRQCAVGVGIYHNKQNSGAAPAGVSTAAITQVNPEDDFNRVGALGVQIEPMAQTQ
jgi:hypothetical protein